MLEDGADVRLEEHTQRAGQCLVRHQCALARRRRRCVIDRVGEAWQDAQCADAVDTTARDHTGEAVCGAAARRVRRTVQQLRKQLVHNRRHIAMHRGRAHKRRETRGHCFLHELGWRAQRVEQTVDDAAHVCVLRRKVARGAAQQHDGGLGDRVVVRVEAHFKLCNQLTQHLGAMRVDDGRSRIEHGRADALVPVAEHRAAAQRKHKERHDGRCRKARRNRTQRRRDRHTCRPRVLAVQRRLDHHAVRIVLGLQRVVQRLVQPLQRVKQLIERVRVCRARRADGLRRRRAHVCVAVLQERHQRAHVRRRHVETVLVPNALGDADHFGISVVQREPERRRELELRQVKRHKALQRTVTHAALVAQRGAQQLHDQRMLATWFARHRLAVRTQRRDAIVRQHRVAAHQRKQRVDHLGARERSIAAARCMRRKHVEHELHTLDDGVVSLRVAGQRRVAHDVGEPWHKEAHCATLQRRVDHQPQLVQHAQLDVRRSLKQKVARRQLVVDTPQHRLLHKSRYATRTLLDGSGQRRQRVHRLLYQAKPPHALVLQHRIHRVRQRVHVCVERSRARGDKRADAAQCMRHARDLGSDARTHLGLLRKLRVNRRLLLLAQLARRRLLLFRRERRTHLGVPLVHAGACLGHRRLRGKDIDVGHIGRRLINGKVFGGERRHIAHRQIAHDATAHRWQDHVGRNKCHRRHRQVRCAAERHVRLRCANHTQDRVALTPHQGTRLGRGQAAQVHKALVLCVVQLRHVGQHDKVWQHRRCIARARRDRNVQHAPEL